MKMQKHPEMNSMTAEAMELERDMSLSDVTKSPACAHDVAAFCQREANIVALLRQAPNEVKPRKVVEAVRIMRLCMISHHELLTTDCVKTLSAGLSEVPRTIGSNPAINVKAFDNDKDVGDDSSMEINIYYSRHHDGAGHALRSSDALAANNIQTGASSSTLSTVLVHPLMWVFVVPFFVIGVYVTVARMAKFMRRRREERRIESKLYMPVN